jgi:hypothetical protein
VPLFQQSAASEKTHPFSKRGVTWASEGLKHTVYLARDAFMCLPGDNTAHLPTEGSH